MLMFFIFNKKIIIFIIYNIIFNLVIESNASIVGMAIYDIISGEIILS